MTIQRTNSDPDYKSAVNYEHDFYNDPITVTIDGKKFILPFGNSDSITYMQNAELVYFVGENTGLNYISMVCIHPESENIDDCFLSDNDLNDTENICYDIFNKDTEEQIEILCNYLQD